MLETLGKYSSGKICALLTALGGSRSAGPEAQHGARRALALTYGRDKAASWTQQPGHTRAIHSRTHNSWDVAVVSSIDCLDGGIDFTSCCPSQKSTDLERLTYSPNDKNDLHFLNLKLSLVLVILAKGLKDHRGWVQDEV